MDAYRRNIEGLNGAPIRRPARGGGSYDTFIGFDLRLQWR